MNVFRRRLKVDKLADALEDMWAGGGEYGVYTVAIEREKVRALLHELLDLPSPPHKETET